jgi:hypothetical protein
MRCHYCKATPDAWAYYMKHEPRLVCPGHHAHLRPLHTLPIVRPL